MFLVERKIKGASKKPLFLSVLVFAGVFPC